MRGTYLYLGGASIVMSWALFVWHSTQNGDRRLHSWVIFCQALGWSLYLGRGLWLVSTGIVPATWWGFWGVLLMAAAQAAHIYYLLQRKHKTGLYWTKPHKEGE